MFAQIFARNTINWNGISGKSLCNMLCGACMLIPSCAGSVVAAQGCAQRGCKMLVEAACLGGLVSRPA